ncbi:MAG: hypothetical protein LBB45_07505 [Methanobrevibacter sp.]|nr:hypothetical protein [Candidatus Methanovirga basalitermitum]
MMNEDILIKLIEEKFDNLENKFDNLGPIIVFFLFFGILGIIWRIIR